MLLLIIGEDATFVADITKSYCSFLSRSLKIVDREMIALMMMMMMMMMMMIMVMDREIARVC